MLKDENFHRQIEQTVGEAEKATSAEIVVTLARDSGSYRDTDMLAGAILAAAGLLAILFAPVNVSPVLVLPYVILVYVVGYAMSARFAGVRRILTGKNRRQDQSREAALLAFHEEGVTATRERNGILLYCSLFEDQAELLPDLGIDGKVQRARWNEIRYAILNSAPERKANAVIAAIKEMGAVLAEPFPPGEDNPDEIPNRPRIRL